MIYIPSIFFKESREKMPSERNFRTKLISDIRDLLPGCVILMPDPNFLQGVPDLIILNGNRWAALETKKALTSSKRANQEYYIDLFYIMSYASFVSRENKEQVLHELQQALQPSRSARIFVRK